MKILFTGGGTVGHISPIIAIIREIRKQYPDEELRFFYVGPKDRFAYDMLSKEDVVIKSIFAGKIRRYFSFKNLIDLFFKTPLGFLQSFYYVFTISPDLIFSKGGYGSVSTVIAGKMLFTPVFIHESDIYPGLSNQIASRFALEIFTGFPIKKNYFFPFKKIIAAGNPVREEVLRGSLEEAKETFNLKEGKPLILILGGSQGSQRMNDVLLSSLEKFLDDFEIIHQTGKDNFEQVKKETDILLPEKLKPYYHPVAFLNASELANAYSVSSLVITRAGAMTIFEIAVLGKPSILVPLPESANNHQVRNAYAYAENGASIVLEEGNFRSHFLLQKLKFLFSHPEELEEMSKKAKEFSTPNSTSVIAEYIVGYLTQ